jgi:hypothetical protein
MKYPMYVQGALASSAPVLYFNGSHTAHPDEMSIIATKPFSDAFNDTRCSSGIREAFGVLMKLKSVNDCWGYLRDNFFHTCDKIEHGDDIRSVINYIR